MPPSTARTLVVALHELDLGVRQQRTEQTGDEVGFEADDVGVAPHDDVALRLGQRLPHAPRPCRDRRRGRASTSAAAITRAPAAAATLGGPVGRVVVDHEDLVDQAAPVHRGASGSSRRWRRPSPPRRAPAGTPRRPGRPWPRASAREVELGVVERRQDRRDRRTQARYPPAGMSPMPAGVRVAVMSVKVRVPTTLRTLTGGKSEVEVEGATVGEVIYGLDTAHPGFAERLLDENGLRRFVNVFVADDDVRFLEGLDTQGPRRRDRVHHPGRGRRL